MIDHTQTLNYSAIAWSANTSAISLKTPLVKCTVLQLVFDTKMMVKSNATDFFFKLY